MLIEITNLCNDACIFCFNKNMVREKGFIDPKLVDKVLKEAWNNEIIRKLRRKQLESDPSNTICSNCIYNSNIQSIPLVKELSSEFEYNNFSDRECLVKRINDFLNFKNNK